MSPKNKTNAMEKAMSRAAIVAFSGPVVLFSAFGESTNVSVFMNVESFCRVDQADEGINVTPIIRIVARAPNKTWRFLHILSRFLRARHKRAQLKSTIRIPTKLPGSSIESVSDKGVIVKP